MNEEKLQAWQKKYDYARSKYEGQISRMNELEKLYKGTEEIAKVVCKDNDEETKHVRNIVKENIEAQVDSTIPQPKVTALRKKDEPLAKNIEDMLRNELDRLSFETMNDQQARTVPVQGGAGFLVEWDEYLRTHTTTGDLAVSALHPRNIIPQDGVYTGIENMDYIFVEVPQTREYIRKRFGKDVYQEGEEHPDARGAEETAEEMVTQVNAYFRNDKGGIGLYSWVGDVELIDLENYQMRQLKRCADCGEPEPIEDPPFDEDDPEQAEMELLTATKKKGRKICPKCGGTKFILMENEYEELDRDIIRSDGSVIPASELIIKGYQTDEMGNEVPVYEGKPTRIPYYVPKVYPIVQIKNTSVAGQFWGGSDALDLIYAQNTTNWLSKKICDKLGENGSITTMPTKLNIERNGKDGRTVWVNDPSELAMIKTFNLQADITQDMAFRDQVYEESRQLTGITDSFQGRTDPTAASGKAKQFAAAQSAGRLQSKKVMRDAAYAELFRRMFQWKLAYADEPRPIVTKDAAGDVQYSEFNRYDFLEQDAAGEWYWNDQFLFSTDVTAPLANNREAMWDAQMQNFQMGAFGNPQETRSQIAYWSIMEMLHYPMAQEIKEQLQQKLEEEIQMQQQMIQQQMDLQNQIVERARADAIQNANQPGTNQQELPMPANMQLALEDIARQQAMRDAGQ
jgi:hypothetical protein